MIAPPPWKCSFSAMVDEAHLSSFASRCSRPLDRPPAQILAVQLKQIEGPRVRPLEGRNGNGDNSRPPHETIMRTPADDQVVDALIRGINDFADAGDLQVYMQAAPIRPTCRAHIDSRMRTRGELLRLYIAFVSPTYRQRVNGFSIRFAL